MTDIPCAKCGTRIAVRRSDGIVLIHHKGMEVRIKMGRATRSCTAYVYKSMDPDGAQRWGSCDHVNVLEVLRAGVGAA